MDQDSDATSDRRLGVLDDDFDRSLMKKGDGVGLVFISPLGMCMRYAIHIHFPISNNVAEYEALVNGLHITI